MFAGSPKTSLLMANCYKFLLQQQGTLGCQSWRVVSVVQPVPKSMTSAGVVGQVVRRQAVKCQPGRLAQVHGDTGRLVRLVCMLFALAHEANEDAVMSSYRLDWNMSRATAFMTAWRRSSFVSTSAATRD